MAYRRLFIDKSMVMKIHKIPCAYHKIKYKTGHRRYKILGWTIEQTLEIKPPPNPEQTTITVKINDQYFKSQAEFSRHLGISSSQVSKLKKTHTMKEIYNRYTK